MKNTTVINDFKDLRKAIEEVTKKQPAQSRYSQQAEKMGYTKDKSVVAEQKLNEKNLMPDFQNIVKTKGAKKVSGVMIDMFTASVITQAYDKVSDENKKKMEKANVNTLVKLAQKVMGLNASHEFDKEPLKGFPFNETIDEWIASDGTRRRVAEKDKRKYKGLKKGKKVVSKKKDKLVSLKVREEIEESKMGDLLIDIQQGATAKELAKDYKIPLAVAKNFLKDYYGSKKTRPTNRSANMPKGYEKLRAQAEDIQEAYPKNSKSGAEVAKMMMKSTTMKGFAAKVKKMKTVTADQLDKMLPDYVSGGDIGKMFEGIQEAFNYSPKDFEAQVKANKYKNGVKFSQVMKDFEDDWDSAFGNRGFDYDNVEDGLKKALKKARINFKESVEEGTWAVPDEFYKLKKVQDLINKKIPGTKANAKKFADDMYSLFGDDGFFDDLTRIEMDPDPKVDLRDILVKHLSDWTVRFKGYKITHGPSQWMQGRIEEKIKKGKGNIKKPTGKLVKFEKLDPVGKGDDDIDNDGDSDDSDKYLKNRRKKISKSMKMKEANKSPFKLKSQAYPRAVGIDTEGYGTRHATRDDLVEACDSFGMITEQELQIEQLQKTLGKSGFLTYNILELNDIFDDRETQRMILALESVTAEEPLDTVEYSRAQIDEALETESEIEFVKPDGMKAVGPILKMCENTYNVKDKHTGKSFTFKYIEEEKVKTFNQIISEAKFPKKLVRQAMGIVWDKRYAGGNMTGAVNAIEKLKKGLSDDPAVSNALRLANESFQSPFFNSLSEDDKAAYQAFFNKAMKKFGISSPSELSGEKEKEFYDYIDKNWKADHEEDTDMHKSYKIDGRRTNFREKMRKLGYIKVR